MWGRWTAFLDRTETGTALALVRIGIATCVLRAMLSMWWSGVYALVWYDIDHGGYRNFGDGTYLYELLGGYQVWMVDALAVTACVGAALLVAGVGGAVVSRLIAFVTLQAFMNLADLNGPAGGSYDELLTNALWLLVLAGPSRTLSVECRRATGSWTSTRAVPLWPRFLIVFQVVLMYTTTGWQKMSAHWVPGGDLSALYDILQQPTWQKVDMSWVAPLFPLTQAATAVTWWWEVTGPVWLLAWFATLDPQPTGWRHHLVRWRVRDAYLVLGVCFHLGVALMMDIGPFSWASLALYPAFFHPPGAGISSPPSRPGLRPASP